MDSKTSITKIENELAASFRNRMKGAEGAGDVQQIFAEFLRDILSRITGSEVVLDEGDVRVDPELEGGFALGPGVAENPEFANFLANTDLLDVLRRQGQHAANKLKHMGKSGRAQGEVFTRPDWQS